MTTTPPSGPNAWQRLPLITRAGFITTGAAAIVGLATGGFTGLLVSLSLVAFFTALYVVMTQRKSWLQIRSLGVGVAVLAGSFALSGLAVASSPNGGSSPIALTSVETQTEATETPTPTPTAVQAATTTKNVVENQDVPFETTTVDDAALAAGTTTVTTPGVVGVRTILYKVTYRNGVEVSRSVVSDTVTTAPVTQVVANGTYVEPAAPVPFADGGGGGGDDGGGGGCDPNYSGACVPIDSDVDCAGGSGNGPSYVSGPVYVVGSDIYGLDRDGDGVACD